MKKLKYFDVCLIMMFMVIFVGVILWCFGVGGVVGDV